jgi:hypothetical protein
MNEAAVVKAAAQAEATGMRWANIFGFTLRIRP